MLYEIAMRVFKQAPKASDDALFEAFWSEAQGMAKEIARLWFSRSITAIKQAAERQTAKRRGSLVSLARAKTEIVAREGVAAIREKAKAEVISMLDSIRLRDGRPIGDVQWYELDWLARENEREAYLLRAVRAFVKVTDDSKRVRDVISSDQMARIVEAAKTWKLARAESGMEAHQHAAE